MSKIISLAEDSDHDNMLDIEPTTPLAQSLLAAGVFIEVEEIAKKDPKFRGLAIAAARLFEALADAADLEKHIERTPRRLM